MMRNRIATSASTRIVAARRAGWTIWMRNAAIARRSSRIDKRWRRIWWHSSNCAKRWERGLCHENEMEARGARVEAWGGRGDGDRAAAGIRTVRMRFEREREQHDVVLRERVEIGDAGTIRDSGRPDVTRAGGDSEAAEVDADAAADGSGGLQRVSHDAGDHAGGRTRESHPGGAGRSRARWAAAADGQQPGLFAVARDVLE